MKRSTFLVISLFFILNDAHATSAIRFEGESFIVAAKRNQQLTSNEKGSSAFDLSLPLSDLRSDRVHKIESLKKLNDSFVYLRNQKFMTV